MTRETRLAPGISRPRTARPKLHARVPRSVRIGQGKVHAECYTSRSGRRRLRDLGEELVVAPRGADLVDQQLEALALLERVQDAAELPHELELLAVEEELLVPGARLLHVDGRVDPALGQPAVEAELHVAGALELLEDHLVHAAARLDESGGDDRQRAALLHIARGAEEFL